MQYDISSIDEFIKYVDGAEEFEIYRGVGDYKEHTLKPSAGRFGNSTREQQQEFEINLLSDFKRKAPLFIDHTPATDLEWMFLGQHHGLPTRLLDWTFNPLVALYFAVNNNNDKMGAVYATTKELDFCTDKSKWQSPFEINKLCKVIPNINHPRYQAQNGLFTIHPEPTKADDSYISSKCLIGGGNDKSKIRVQLRRLGITRSQLFPGLDGLAYDIKQMNLDKHAVYFKDDEGKSKADRMDSKYSI